MDDLPTHDGVSPLSEGTLWCELALLLPVKHGHVSPDLGKVLLLEPDLGSVVDGLQAHDNYAPAPVEHGQVSLFV